MKNEIKKYYNDIVRHWPANDIWPNPTLRDELSGDVGTHGQFMRAEIGQHGVLRIWPTCGKEDLW